MSDMLATIEANNATHVVDEKELALLVEKAGKVYREHFDGKVWFERSVFINWTCGIADCKYCYLSTVPKLKKDATRSKASILAECLICEHMGWKVGYLTGGLRVEKTSELISLMDDVAHVIGRKPMMNFGPYTEREITSLVPHIAGMGSAIESFDEELHAFICPSKPLAALMRMLAVLKEKKMRKIITIILGMGEKKSDVQEVIEKIKEYEIDVLQLCFLKPQENTVFSSVPAPDPQYMAWWISTVRIACPNVVIKVALVRERMSDVELYLNAGANCFSRFMVFNDVGTSYAQELVDGCKRAGRALEGSFLDVPEIDVDVLVDALDFDEELRESIRIKAKQYYVKLKKLSGITPLSM